MARTERTRRRTARSTSEPAEPEQPRSPLLKPETRHGVVIVVILTVAAVAGLSVFGFAGLLGNAIGDALGTMFGWQRYLVPIYLAVVGVILLFPERYHVTRARWIGAALAFIASEGLLQMFLSPSEAISRAIAGDGGGYAGVLLSHPLRSAFGPVASVLVMIGLLVVGWLILFNTSLRSFITPTSALGKLVARWKTRRWDNKLQQEQSEAEEEEQPEFSRQDISDDETQEETVEDEPEEELVPIPPKPVKRQHRSITIPIDLLDTSSTTPTSGDIDANKEKIRKTLETFGISVEMGDVNVGPTVTQFTLKPADGVKLSQITSLNNDLALALAAHPIRIEAPIPGKSLVGIEVPNQSVALVPLRDLLGSNEFKQRTSNLAFGLGKDVSGKPWITNLDPLPHLLIAGATGSGKSVMVNGLILSLLYSNSPDDLKLILVDPKRVELSLYNGIPHLLTPVITDTTKTINALRWVVGEMDRRYGVLQNAGKRNIASYRKEISDDMPYIVVVIDELADLMSVAANEVEGAIVRLAQMARAVGIHLVLATQRPSVDVITGLIKANVTARIAFSVASQIDSRTILDNSGAEKLLGKGDMLFISAELSKPKRLQGAFVGEKEVERVAQFLKTRAQPDYITEVVDKPMPALGQSLEDLGDDELLSQAKDVISQAGKASASLLQRRLRIGYARAARILDLLEEEGFIGPGDGAKPREVFGGPTESAPPSLPPIMSSDAPSEVAVDDEESSESEEEQSDAEADEEEDEQQA